MKKLFVLFGILAVVLFGSCQKIDESKPVRYVKFENISDTIVVLSIDNGPIIGLRAFESMEISEMWNNRTILDRTYLVVGDPQVYPVKFENYVNKP